MAICTRPVGRRVCRPVGGFAAAVVGADRMRPKPPQQSCPLNGTSPARSALGSTSGGAGSPNGLTEGVSSVYCNIPYFRSAPPQLRVRSAAFNNGMIATGNHNFEKFAALCNTPEGAPRALRARELCKPVFERHRTGRVRKPTYWYKPCALLSGGTAARCRPPLKNSQIRNWFYKIYCVLCGDTL